MLLSLKAWDGEFKARFLFRLRTKKGSSPLAQSLSGGIIFSPVQTAPKTANDFFMEHLFTATLTHLQHPRQYDVSFDNEQYRFQPLEGGLPFSLRREQDTWLSHDDLAEELQQQAIAALDNYLSRQH